MRRERPPFRLGRLKSVRKLGFRTDLFDPLCQKGTRKCLSGRCWWRQREDLVVDGGEEFAVGPTGGEVAVGPEDVLGSSPFAAKVGEDLVEIDEASGGIAFVAGRQRASERISPVAIEEIEGFVDSFIVEGVEESELLVTVADSAGGVRVENEAFRSAGTGDEILPPDRAVKIFDFLLGDTVLPAGDGGLGGEEIAGSPVIGYGLEEGIMPCGVGVPGVLVTGYETVNAVPEDPSPRMFDLSRPGGYRRRPRRWRK